ncbi:hypothetical protein RFI_23645, partial [Reticulomyxa filosa]
RAVQVGQKKEKEEEEEEEEEEVEEEEDVEEEEEEEEKKTATPKGKTKVIEEVNRPKHTSRPSTLSTKISNKPTLGTRASVNIMSEDKTPKYSEFADTQKSNSLFSLLRADSEYDENKEEGNENGEGKQAAEEEEEIEKRKIEAEKNSNNNEEEEKRADDEAIHEPQVKYVRMFGEVHKEIQKDKACFLTAHSRYLVLGRESGSISICDTQGNIIKTYRPHTQPINDISVSGNGDYVASCAKNDSAYKFFFFFFCLLKIDKLPFDQIMLYI